MNIRSCVACLTVGAAVILAATPLAADAARATPFPGPASQSVSPDGRWEIVWVEAQGEREHRLELVARPGGEVARRLDFARRVEVLWSAGSSEVAVTRFNASDSSDVLVWSLGPAVGEFRFAQDLARGDARLRELLEKNHHAWLRACRWSDAALELAARGHGDLSPDGFVACAVWRPRIGTVERVEPKSPGQGDGATDSEPGSCVCSAP